YFTGNHMRQKRFFMAASGLAATGALIAMSGCDAISNIEAQCKSGEVCRAALGPPDGGGEGGHVDFKCDGSATDIDSKTMLPKAFSKDSSNKDCSLFAWAGSMDPSADGTMENPFPKIQDAINLAQTTG